MKNHDVVAMARKQWGADATILLKIETEKRKSNPEIKTATGFVPVPSWQKDNRHPATGQYGLTGTHTDRSAPQDELHAFFRQDATLLLMLIDWILKSVTALLM